MSRPLAIQRHHEILKQIGAVRSVSVEALATRFDVSHETIRRDLKLLAAQGYVEIVHGGALKRDSREAPYAVRQDANVAGKAAIAACAVAQIADGMVVLLDSGTTILALSVALARAGRRGLTIYTTSLANAQLLVRAGLRVTMLGGEVDPDDEATFGVDVIAAIVGVRVDCAFVGVGGLSADGIFTDFSRPAAAQRAAMLDVARQGFLLTDHLKFGLRAPIVVPIGVRRPILVTDRRPPPETEAILARRGVAILTPQSNNDR